MSSYAGFFALGHFAFDEVETTYTISTACTDGKRFGELIDMLRAANH